MFFLRLYLPISSTCSFGAPKQFKNCFVIPVRSEMLCIDEGGSKRARELLVGLKVSILQVWNAVLVSSESDVPVLELAVDFFRSEVSSQLNGKFKSDRVHAVLQKREFHSGDLVFF